MTTDRDGNRSNPYKPNPEKCCEACIFGSGEHAAFCDSGNVRALPLMVHLPAGRQVILRKHAVQQG